MAGIAFPSYPVAQATDEVAPYVVAEIPVNMYPVSDGELQSKSTSQSMNIFILVYTEFILYTLLNCR